MDALQWFGLVLAVAGASYMFVWAMLALAAWLGKL